MVNIVGVRFKKASKVYDFDANSLELAPGEEVIVEVERGLGMGTVVNRPREVDPATVVRQLKKVVRKADAVDQERHGFNLEREKEAFDICREKIARFKLPMKLIRVEYLFDSSKAIFYFTSETRVDFRELVKDLASGFHTRIEMRQVGVRDEAKMIGGLGPCGRELCCAGFLSDFEPVTIKMAKEQGLALNPVKISGICGRLMCCLSYEHEMYKGEKAERQKKQQKEVGCGGCPGHGEGHHGHGAEQKGDGAPAEAQGDRGGAPCGEQADRGPRPGGARGDRGPRPGGARGDRGPRPSGAQGDRGPRPGGAQGARRADKPEGPPAPVQADKMGDKPEGATVPAQADKKGGRPEGSGGPRNRGPRKRRGRSRSSTPSSQGNPGKEGS